MPFKSEKQMRYMYAQHPEIARRWVKEEKAKAKKEKRVTQYVVAKSAFGVEHAGLEEINKAGFGSLLRLGASSQKSANTAMRGAREVKAVQDMSGVSAGPKNILDSVRSAKKAAVKPKPFTPNARPTGFKGTGTTPTPKPTGPAPSPAAVKSNLSQKARGFGSGLKTGRVPNATPSGVRSGRLKPLTKPQQSFQSGAKAGAKVRNAPAAVKGKLVRSGRNISSSVRGGAARAANTTREAASRAGQRGKLVALKAGIKSRNAAAGAKGKLVRVSRGASEKAAAASQRAKLAALKTDMKARSAAGRLKSTGRKAANNVKAAPGKMLRTAKDLSLQGKEGFKQGAKGVKWNKQDFAGGFTPGQRRAFTGGNRVGLAGNSAKGKLVQVKNARAAKKQAALAAQKKAAAAAKRNAAIAAKKKAAAAAQSNRAAAAKPATNAPANAPKKPLKQKGTGIGPVTAGVGLGAAALGGAAYAGSRKEQK